MKMEYKMCSMCRKGKKVDQFHFYPSTNNYATYCKECKKIYEKRMREQRVETNLQKEKPEEHTRKCYICNEYKSSNEFYYSKTNGTYGSYCKMCHLQRNKEHRERKLSNVKKM